MSIKLSCFTILVATALVSGCDQGPKSPRGFSLPDGNVEQGRVVFLESGCLACHNISGVDDKGIKKESEIPIPLGGLVSKPVAYGELVTSIINPSHRISKYALEQHTTPEGESIMRNYNDLLTVSQLIDLVAYLESEYKVVEYKRSYYIEYP